MPLDLPKDLAKGELTLTADTAADYWSLRYRGFEEVDGPALASVPYDELTPAQKRARTLAEKRAAEHDEPTSQNPDVDPNAQAGDANEHV